MDLLIVSHVPHGQLDGQIHAYGPYAREIEMWADLFDQIVIACPFSTAIPGPGDELIGRSNVTLARQPNVGEVDGIRRVMRTLRALRTLGMAMARCHAIHVRCPGNLGLLGVLAAPIFSHRLVAKYAGSWPDYPDEPDTYRLQKRILRSRWWRGPVTVYGSWHGEPPKVTPFFTAAMHRAQLQEATEIAEARTRRDTIRVLFVGRLSAAKNVNVLLHAVHQLRQDGISLTCAIVGEGPERSRLEELASRLGLDPYVSFRGPVALDDMPSIYTDADVLVLVSRSEGWPKAIAEAMAFGLVCIGSDQGFIPQMLAEGRGFCVAPGDLDGLVGVMRRLAQDPDWRTVVGLTAAEWASAFALEDLRDAIRDMLQRSWGVSLPPP